jgi:hypothetical protein
MFKLPPDEARKRMERREKNKEAAARCRKKREDLTKRLTLVILNFLFSLFKIFF